VLLLSASACFGSDTEPAAPAADGTLPALTSIAGNGMMNTHPFDYLEQLSDQIGGRVTGSPEARKAIEWGVAKMKAIGLENVHTEKWQLSRGWKRISAEAAIVEPVQRRLMIDSMGWVGSTQKGGVEAEVLPVNILQLEEEMKSSSKWAGKVLLLVRKGEPPTPSARGTALFMNFLKMAYTVHAVAVIGGQGGSEPVGMHLTHTGAMGFDAYYDIPIVSMAIEDLRQLQRFVDRGTRVRLRINVQNEVTSGPVETANVVGEIRGKEFPEQVIV
jgi:hypothetical protein